MHRVLRRERHRHSVCRQSAPQLLLNNCKHVRKDLQASERTKRRRQQTRPAALVSVVPALLSAALLAQTRLCVSQRSAAALLAPVCSHTLPCFPSHTCAHHHFIKCSPARESASLPRHDTTTYAGTARHHIFARHFLAQTIFVSSLREARNQPRRERSLGFALFLNLRLEPPLALRMYISEPHNWLHSA